jgi:hypothetical protein
MIAFREETAGNGSRNKYRRRAAVDEKVEIQR